MYFLFMGYSLSYCILAAMAGLVILTLINKRTRWAPVNLLKVFEGTARMAALVGSVLICIGVLVGNFAVSGMGDLFSSLIVTVSGGNLLVGLIITAFVCLILGMGMPGTAVYVTVLLLGVPALISLGAPEISAHFFCFWWGMMAALTPPVCVAVYTACTISGGKVWPTAFIAVRLGAVAYLVIFLVPYFPELLWQGPLVGVLTAALFAFVGAPFLVGALAGYFFLGRLNMIERVFLAVGGIFLIIPETSLTVLGLIVVAIVILPQWFRLARRRSSALGKDGESSR